MKKIRKMARRFLDIRAFRKDRARFEAFLGTVPREAKFRSNGKRVGILVSTAHYTAIPWYVITLALLYKFRGFEPCLVFDDIAYADTTRTGDQNRVIGKVLSKISGDLEVLKLSDFDKSALNELDAKEIERLCQIYLVARFRSSVPHEGWEPFREKLRKTLTGNLARVKTLLARQSFDHLVLQGGLWGNTGLFFWAARQMKLRAATYDSGFGIIFTSIDDIAAHQTDVANIFELKLFGTPDSSVRRKTLELATKELQHRMHGTEKSGGGETVRTETPRFQNTPYCDRPQGTGCDVLMLLNVDFDAAALGKQKFFKNPHEWMMETTAFVLKNTAATIGVRQHPYERSTPFRAKHDLRSELERAFPGNSRLRFIPAEENVNTYNLLEAARLVLPLTSTAGVEAAALGKRVIMASDSYYSGMSFVDNTLSKEQYFKKIAQRLDSPEPLSQEKKEDALLCFFAGQIANRISSSFTPQPADFDRWVKEGFSALLTDASVQGTLTTWSEGVPAVVWRMKEILAKEKVESH